MNQTPQNAKGETLSVKKSALSPDRKGLKTSRVAWVLPDQHEEVDANPGKPDSAYINKK